MLNAVTFFDNKMPDRCCEGLLKSSCGIYLPTMEERLIAEMVRHMQENDVLPEQFERLGLVTLPTSPLGMGWKNSLIRTGLFVFLQGNMPREMISEL